MEQSLGVLDAGRVTKMSSLSAADFPGARRNSCPMMEAAERESIPGGIWLVSTS